ncbi:DUF262 domain-containing protein [Paeniglutamicibacter sp. ZC-3]|uniref:DUF262 domain-containing protein n=1 Tax=Paeniglutamicibacter sp. ZC-3 TaxID=2986919 RepID=UPI0021F7EDBF|nr:DUF262 domain-containing protein [Paeniglutamicibacter sp. ZC-3]MCV9994256.1 DUF262 domain-containing protein [Paeniglutamicibacter sp. ZC-3]
MGTQVEASTIKAGQLFSTADFHIPDFQRDYSWTVDAEVSDFWNDFSKGIDNPPYFLGLLILTDEENVKTVVDGQQRIVTLTLLANAIRKAAMARNKILVADSMRDVFLFAINYETDSRSPRVDFASKRDHSTLEKLLNRESTRSNTNNLNQRLIDAQIFLDNQLESDLDSGDESARLGKWAHFLSNGLTFAVFEHPDRNAAYKVFEVVNMRGKDLTPAQLIKSYVIGSAGPENQKTSYDRWTALEEPFLEIGADSQFTQFIRNVVTLRHGYVEPRDLYQAINENYKDSSGTSKLLTELEAQIDLYLQMVNPVFDTADDQLKAFLVLDALGLRTIRPIFLAIAKAANRDKGFEALLRVIVPRIVTGTFGTGSIERKFSDAAKTIFNDGDWQAGIQGLNELIPTKNEFTERLQSRPLNKGVQHVIRASVFQDTPLPVIDGYLHQIRPRKIEDWPDFTDEDYRVLGSTIGNSFIAQLDRRPRGSNSEEGVIEKLLPMAMSYEDPSLRTSKGWSVDDVRNQNADISRLAAEVWYE